jgi:hypothetical protein
MIKTANELKRGEVFKPRGPRGSCKAWQRITFVRRNHKRGTITVRGTWLSTGFLGKRVFSLSDSVITV